MCPRVCLGDYPLYDFESSIDESKQRIEALKEEAEKMFFTKLRSALLWAFLLQSGPCVLAEANSWLTLSPLSASLNLPQSNTTRCFGLLAKQSAESDSEPPSR